MNTIFTIIKKLLSVLIVGVSVTVLILPISFAVNPAVVTANMPEPVADQYNRYIVVNDLLIWVSYQIDYVYEILNPTESVWYTRNLEAIAEYSEDSEGTYFLPGQSLHGNSVTSGSTGTVWYDDVWFTPFAPTSSGIQNGQSEPISTSSIGSATITYDDAELALTKVGQTEVSELYNLQCIISSQNNIIIRLRRNRRLDSIFLTTLNFYVSIIYIPTGECINRTQLNSVDTAFDYKQVTVNLGSIDSEYEENGYIVSLQTYGMLCSNYNDLQYDRPLIIWNTNSNWDSYFLNTMLYVEEIWRNMVQVTSPVEPDTTARWGEDLSDATPQNDLNVRPAGQEIALDNAINNIHFSPQNQDKFEQWTGMFSNGKLIACCVFALACGSVILTLGKKKSE